MSAATTSTRAESETIAEVERESGDVAKSELGHATEHRETHSESDKNPLAFQKELALWTAVVFVILLAFLWKFAWGPIRDGLDKREQGIFNEVEAANEANRKAKALLEEYENKLAGGEDEVRVMLDKARRDAEEVGRRLVEKAKADAVAERDETLREVESAKSGALRDLARRSADMAVLLAGRIVDAELKPSDHARLVKEAIDDFSPQSDRT